MFISKLVCDKCGTEADTTDNYCRSCGASGKKIHDGSKLADLIDGTSRCELCGKLVDKYGRHQCEGGGSRKKYYEDSNRYGLQTKLL